MRVAVTGANGFIGRHVLSVLAKHDVETIAVLRRPDVGDLPNVAGTRVCEIGPNAAYMDTIGNPDVLIHLAWGGLPNYHSLHHFEEELPAQYAFLSGLIRDGLKSIVVAGTCFEYGMQSGSLCEEMPMQPANCYGFAKSVLLKKLELLRGVHPFNLAWGRLFYLYGEGQNKNSLFSQVRAAVERGQDSFNMSSGEQLRDYLPVEAAADQLVRLALSHNASGAVNICSGDPISVRRLVECWIVENGWSLKLNLGCYPLPDYEPLAFWGSNKKLKEISVDMFENEVARRQVEE